MNDTSPRPRAHQSRGDATSRRLLAAAALVLARDGYDNTRVQDIARLAGVTTGAIYAQFRDKAALLDAAVRTVYWREVEEVMAPAESDSLAASAVFAQLAQRLVDLPVDEAEVLFEAMVGARRDTEFAAYVEQRLARRREQMQALVSRAQASGEFAAEVDPETFARFCNMLMIGAVVNQALQRPTPRPAEWASLMARLIGSLRTAQPEPAAPALSSGQLLS